VVAFRNGRVTVIANLGDTPVELPAGDVVLASGDISGRAIPTDTTVWVI
jgi:alpha-glucosidase